MSTLTRELIYQELRNDILSCKISPGEELREMVLAERFSASKQPVRDALHRLRAEGLISVVPRRGYRVVPISVGDAQELFELRQMIEEACLVKGCRAAKPEALSELNIFRDQDIMCEDAEWVDYNRRFHRAIVSLCPNRRMVAMALDLIDQFDRLIAASISLVGRPDRNALLQEHCQIIDALQQREGRLAARLLKKHIASGRQRVMTALESAAIVK